MKDASAVPTLIELLASGDRAVVIESVRALGRIGDRGRGPDALVKLIQAKDTSAHVRLEAVDALGDDARSRRLRRAARLRSTDPNPAIRAAALRSAAALEPEQFVAVLSGLDPDPVWSVRAAIATVLGTHAARYRAAGTDRDAWRKTITASFRRSSRRSSSCARPT